VQGLKLKLLQRPSEDLYSDQGPQYDYAEPHHDADATMAVPEL